MAGVDEGADIPAETPAETPADTPAETSADSATSASTAGSTPAAGQPAMSRVAIIVTASLSAAVLVVGAVLGWLLYSTSEVQGAENTRAEAAAVAATRVQQIFEYDHATVREEMARALDGTTGEFRTTFEQEINNNVIPRTEEQEKTVTVTVINQATIESTSDSASVLVFMNQMVKSNTGPKMTYTPSRVKVDMVRKDGVWKVSGLQVI